MDQSKNSLKESLMAKIDAGQVKMRPKWHFVLKAALVAVGVIIFALAALLLVSFISFALHQTGVWFVPVFGLRGIGAFLTSLPWLLILAAIIFIIALEILVKHYGFAYRKPLLYSLLVILVFVALGSLVISKAGLHQGLLNYSERKRLPLAGPMYHRFGEPRFKNVHPGIIADINESGFTIVTPKNETMTVIVTEQTRFPFGLDFATGDRVVVFGERDNGAVRAFGIRRIDEEKFVRPPHMPGWRGPGMTTPFPR